MIEAAMEASTIEETGPRAFASTARLGGDELLGAPVRWPRPSALEAELGLTGKAADGAAALGLHTVGDLLEHLPRARREARTVAMLGPGEAAMAHQTDEYCNMERIRQSVVIYEAIIRDWTGA